MQNLNLNYHHEVGGSFKPKQDKICKLNSAEVLRYRGKLLHFCRHTNGLQNSYFHAEDARVTVTGFLSVSSHCSVTIRRKNKI